MKSNSILSIKVKKPFREVSMSYFKILSVTVLLMFLLILNVAGQDTTLTITSEGNVGIGMTKFSCVRYGNVIGSRGSIIRYSDSFFAGCNNCFVPYTRRTARFGGSGFGS